MNRPFGVPFTTGKALAERFILLTKKQFHRLFALACTAVLSTLALASPASAQDPYADVLVSSFQRTCNNIDAEFRGGSLNLTASCLNSNGNRVPASINLRGVHKYDNNQVRISPTSKESTNLAGCSVSSVGQTTVSVNIKVACNGVASTLHVHEITNTNGSFRYETDKIYRLAAESIDDDSIFFNDEEIELGDDERSEMEQRVKSLLKSEAENPHPRNLSRLSPAEPTHVLLDRRPEYEDPMVVYVSSPVINNEGRPATTVVFYENAGDALVAYESAFTPG